MHLVLLDRWNELDSPLHRLDPRAKLAAFGALILFLLLPGPAPWMRLASGALLVAALLALSRVPAGYCLKHATLVLPFSVLAVGGALAGRLVSNADGWMTPAAAAVVVARSYLSALAVLLLAATTRLPDLLQALARLHAPETFLAVVHFLYRYLFVLSEEAQHMNYARLSRSGARPKSAWRAAAGSLGVLFARTYDRAERIHRAMLARGFRGLFPLSRPLRWTARDGAFASLMLAYLAASYWLARRVSP